MASRPRPRPARPNTAAVERRGSSRTLAGPAILLAAIVDDGTIAYVDELVGRLAAHLKAQGLYEGATIALLSDHDEGLGDHGEQEHGVFLYDSTMHVPFIVKLPGERDAGKRVAARKAFTSALALDPALATALNGLGVVELHSGNRAGAIDAWKRAVAADARQFDTLFDLGVTLRDGGDAAGAREYLQRFAETAPPAFYARDIAKVKAWLGER